MNQKQNIILVGATLFAFMLGCGQRKETIKTDVSNSPTPTVAKTPSEEEKIRDFVNKSKDLCKFETKEKLDSKAKIKGKIAVVDDFGLNSCRLDGFDSSNKPLGIETFGIKKENLALSTGEIDTLIKVKCEEGSQIGVYTYPGYPDTPAYAKECEVTVSDYKNFVTFGKKNFVGRMLEKNVNVSRSTGKVIAAEPYEQIGKYLTSLQAK